MNKKESGRFVYGILYRFYSQQKKGNNKVEENVVKQESNNVPQVSLRSKVEKKVDKDSGLSKYTSDDKDLIGDNNNWKLELAWLTKALEPALQLCRWALPTGLFMSTFHSFNCIVFLGWL